MIKHKLLSGIEDEVFDTFYQLYYKQDPKYLTELILGDDALIKVNLARLLADFTEAKAVGLLVKLIDDANEIVSLAAIHAYGRNQLQNKSNFLLALLRSNNTKALIFAINELAINQVIEAVDELLLLLKSSEDVVLLKLLASLRFFKDRRILPAVLPYLKSDNVKVRYYALLAYGSLFQLDPFYSRRLLYPFLKDPDVRIRRAALWCLKRDPARRDLKLLHDILQNEETAVVREEALLVLSKFKNVKVLQTIVKYLSREQHWLVVLKGGSLLQEFPRKLLLKVLGKFAANADKNLRRFALTMLANLQLGNAKISRQLLAELHQCEDLKIKIGLVQALGNIASESSAVALKTLLDEHILLAASALAGLTKIIPANDTNYWLALLNDEKIKPILKQIILKYLLKHFRSIDFVVLQPVLISWLGSSNLNLRYLSSQLLLKSDDADLLFQLFNYMLHEVEAQVLNAITLMPISMEHKLPALIKVLAGANGKEKHFTLMLQWLLRLANDSGLSLENANLIVHYALRQNHELALEMILGLLVNNKIKFADLFAQPELVGSLASQQQLLIQLFAVAQSKQLVLPKITQSDLATLLPSMGQELKLVILAWIKELKQLGEWLPEFIHWGKADSGLQAALGKLI